MLCRRFSDAGDFADPDASGWTAVEPHRIVMVPAPLGLQPTPYIIVSWTDRPYGELAEVEARAVHDGQRLAIRLEWRDMTADHGEKEDFPDAAAVTFPVHGTPELMQMGTPEAPIHLLQWKARKDEIRSGLATGIGTSGPGPDISAAARSHHADGIWRLVMSRRLDSPPGGAGLTPDQTTQMGVAIWNGHNQERAGIKAVSPDWIEFHLEG